MKKKGPAPPVLAAWILSRITRGEERLSILSDFSEIYEELIFEEGTFNAKKWYWTQVLKSIPMFVINHSYWRFVMFKNYVKIALRNIKRNKIFSFINITGLAVSMAAFILIMLFVQHELSFDRYHENADKIYRVIEEKPGQASPISAEIPSPMAPVLMDEYPEVISATRIFKWGRSEKLFLYGKKLIYETLHYADPETFDVFSIAFIQGDPKTALNDPFSIVLSERLAEKYFRNENPIGKVLILKESSDQHAGTGSNYQISGIFENMPQNSHFIMDMIVPFKNLILSHKTKMTWEKGNNPHTYILLAKSTDPKDLEKKFHSLLKKYKYQNTEVTGDPKEKYFLQPLTSIHLDTHVSSDITSNYDIKYIYLYSSVAFLILIVGCINYINLATARSTKRGKEVGIRKVVGAKRGQLVKQFLSESFILIFIALIMSSILVRLLLPYFNSITGKSLSFNPINNLQVLLGFTFIILFVGFSSGCYPAFYISSIRPISNLSNKFIKSEKGFGLRNFLVVAQFSITSILIVSTLVINKQLNFIQNKDMGYNREQIIVSNIQNNVELRNNIDAAKRELTKNPNILSVCCSSGLPNDIGWKPRGLPAKKQGEFVPTYAGIVDYDFLDVYGIEIVEGRNFSRNFPADAERAVLINEMAAKACRWDSPIGKEFEIIDWDGRSVKIIGIIKNFHSRSLHQPKSPLLLGLSSSWKVHLSIKINTANIQETIDYIEKILKEFAPNYPYEFRFFDEIFGRAYQTEQEMGNIISAFAFLSIFIGCLGLFGLASFATEQRTKEIGIRKVLGASVEGIMSLLLKNMAKWVLTANVITWPLSYFLMHKWLQNYAYRIPVYWWFFILTGALTCGIAVITISYKVIRAATANPVDSLRYE